MLKTALLALVASPLLVSAQPETEWALGTINSDWPPAKYDDKEAGFGLIILNNVEDLCGSAGPTARIIACASREDGIMVMPNPCAPKFRAEYYAKILCHEKAHIVGWPGDHPAE